MIFWQVSVGWTSLHHACFAGLPDRVQSLLSECIDAGASCGPPGRETTPVQLVRDGLKAAILNRDNPNTIERWRCTENLILQALLEDNAVSA